MQHTLIDDHPTYNQERAGGDMSYRATASEAGYTAVADQQFADHSGWCRWPLTLATQQPSPIFPAAATPQHSPSTKPFNGLDSDHFECPAPNPSDIYNSYSSVPRRHTVHVPQTVEHDYGFQQELYFASSFSPVIHAHQNWSLASNYGFWSPPATTPSSRTSITSSNTDLHPHSPIASDRYPNQTAFNTQSSPVSAVPFQIGPCWNSPFSYSPPVSDSCPPLPQLDTQDTTPQHVEESDDPEPIMCYAPDCMAEFTGEYQKGNLKRHIKSNHPELLVQNGESPGDPEKLRCSRCPQVFKRSDARKKHEWRAHKVPGTKPAKKYRPNV